MIDRRRFNSGAAAATIAVATGHFAHTTGSAAAQVRADTAWQAYRDIVTAAKKLGLSVPRVDGDVKRLDTENAIPLFSDLVQVLEQNAAGADRNADKIDELIERAAELLRDTTAKEAPNPSEGRLGARALAVRRRGRPVLDDDLRREYEILFRSAEVRSEYRGNVAWYVNRLKDPDNQRRYREVAEATCVPWFAVGIIHGLEASFNFRGHLHNGDSLKRKTRNIPRGRPAVWEPPYRWETSAIDALQYDKLDNQEDWSLASTLYRWEGYNGFRSRTIYNINTPYLWSFSNHYTRGKFIADNKWSGSAVSKQCGAAVMLKMLVDEGLVTIPA